MRTLSEAECYFRCYGWCGSDESVRLLPSTKSVSHELPAFRGGSTWLDGLTELPVELRLAGENIRRSLESRLDAREAEAA
jgi:hypothetical protein